MHSSSAAAAAQAYHQAKPAESDDTWLVEMKFAFPSPTATRCCSS